VTGVPGSGKTLAGLNIATRRSEEHRDEHAVFLSGNGPLVDVLREALARDKVRREGVSKKTAEREVRSFIQNIHHFRDHYVGNDDIPVEKVVVFDEAQRAWTREQAANRVSSAMSPAPRSLRPVASVGISSADAQVERGFVLRLQHGQAFREETTVFAAGHLVTKPL
jgi:hypothetical protein